MVMRVAAVSRRSAVPIPIGRILSRCAGSLCNAITYCATRYGLTSSGVFPVAIAVIKVVKDLR